MVRDARAPGDRTAGAVTRADRTAPWRVASALVTALAAAVTIASSVTPDLSARARVLDAIEPTGIQAVAHIAGALAGLGLLALCPALLQGERRAGRRAVALLCAVAVVHAVKGLDVEEAVVALGAAAVVGLGLRRTGPGAWPGRATAAAAAVGVALLGLYAGSLAWVLARGVPEDLGAAALQAAGVAWSLAEGDATAAVQGDWRLLLHVLGSAAVVAAALGLRALVAPTRARDGHDASAHGWAAELVARHGTDSLAPFVLRSDKAFFFAEGGVLAYRTLGGTAVVSGDPVGPAGAAPAILSRFLTFAADHGWDVVVMAAGDTHLKAYRALGLRTLQIGLEAVSEPGSLSLAGGRHKSLRKAVARVQRRGWTVEVVRAADLAAAARAELAAVQRAWAAERPRVSGFSMAMDRLWGAPEDARDLYVLGRAPDGALHGFLRFLPYECGLSLDAMRRLGEEPNGFTEALVVAGLRHAAEAGCAEVSLNFAGFAHVMAADAILGRRGRLLRLVLRGLHRRFQLERLARFNERFDPVWRPRHLVYTSATRLPLAALRVLQAEAYVKPPRARPRRDAWRPADVAVPGWPMTSGTRP